MKYENMSKTSNINFNNGFFERKIYWSGFFRKKFLGNYYFLQLLISEIKL